MSTNTEDAPLLARSEKENFDDEPPQIHSMASLSSFVDFKIDKLATVPEVIMNSFKSFVGSGILGLPYGFSKGGWALSLMAFPLASFVAGYCMLDLVSCKMFRGEQRIRTYADCGKEAFGPFGTIIVQMALICYQLGCCCSYMLFITENLELLVPALKQQFWVLIMVAVFWLLSFIRSLKVTATLSFIANISLVIALTCLVVGILCVGNGTGSATAFCFRTFSTFFGIVLFAFEGAGLVLPIHGSMAKKQHYPKALVVVLVMVCTLNSTFGLVNYLKLRDNTPELITSAISTHYMWLRVVVTLLLVLTLIVSFHLLIFPVFEALDMLRKMRRLKRKKRKAFWVLAYFFRFLIIACCGIPSVTPLRKHFPSFVGIIGATFGSLLAFLLPPILHLKICWYRGMTQTRKVIDIVVLSIMVPASIAVTVFSIIDLVHTIQGHK